MPGGAGPKANGRVVCAGRSSPAAASADAADGKRAASSGARRRALAGAPARPAAPAAGARAAGGGIRAADGMGAREPSDSAGVGVVTHLRVAPPRRWSATSSTRSRAELCASTGTRAVWGMLNGGGSTVQPSNTMYWLSTHTSLVQNSDSASRGPPCQRALGAHGFGRCQSACGRQSRSDHTSAEAHTTCPFPSRWRCRGITTRSTSCATPASAHATSQQACQAPFPPARSTQT